MAVPYLCVRREGDPIAVARHSVRRPKKPPAATTDSTNLSTSCQIGSPSTSFVMKIPKAEEAEEAEEAEPKNF